MSTTTIAFLGDIYGSPGRMVVQQQLPRLREAHSPDLVIANAENARSGSGISPKLYHRIREFGIDAITLGDHVYRDQTIASVLEAPEEPIARPANISRKAVGRRWIRLDAAGERTRAVYVVTVLGRIFFNMPADDPFATLDALLEELPERDPLVIVEAHMEATSEKAALAHYFDGRVAAVLGTHTHVPTADARILPRGTAFVTDVGMCGPYHSIIGAEIGNVVKAMTTGMHVPFGVGAGDEALSAVVMRIDEASRRSLSIEHVRFPADRDRPPFRHDAR